MMIQRKRRRIGRKIRKNPPEIDGIAIAIVIENVRVIAIAPPMIPVTLKVSKEKRR
jgi:hypothetical protein